MADNPPRQSLPINIEGNEMYATFATANDNSGFPANFTSNAPKSILKKLPTELLTLILKLYFEEQENCDRGVGSKLFQALSANPGLYIEALTIFYEKYPLLIHKDNFAGFESHFSSSKLLLARHLCFELNPETTNRSTAPEDILPDTRQQAFHAYLDRFITSNPGGEDIIHNSPTANDQHQEVINSPPQPPPKLTLLQNLKTLTLQFQVRDVTESHGFIGALHRLDRITLFLENLLSQFTKIEELRLILLMAGASGFAANFWDKMHVLLGVEGDFIRGMRRDGSGTVKMKDKYTRTDEWVWRATGGLKGLRKMVDVRRGVLGEW